MTLFSYRTGYVVESSPHDVDELVKDIRKADLEEIEATTSIPTLDALKLAYTLSDKCYTGISCSNKVICMFGVCGKDGEAACIWMIGTNEINKVSRDFLRASKEALTHLLKHHPILYNYIHADNKVAIQWLRWLGFKFIKIHENYGAKKQKFYEFCKIQPVTNTT